MVFGSSKLVSGLASSFYHALNAYETITLILLRKLASCRFLLYGISLYIICNSYISDKYYKHFSYIFILVSVLQIIAEKYSSSYTMKKHLRTLVQSFLITSSLILITCISHGLKFFYDNHDAILRNIRLALKLQDSLFKTATTALGIFAIPASAIISIYAKYQYYVKLPDYKSDFYKLNIFTGKPIKVDIRDEGITLPMSQIIQMLVNYFTTKNTFTLMSSSIDILNGFIDYTGHKKACFYWPMIFSGLLSIFVSMVGFCQYVKVPMNLLIPKSTYC